MDYTQLSDTELQEAINFHRRQRNMSRSINEAAHMRQTQIVRLLEAEEARRLDEANALGWLFKVTTKKHGPHDVTVSRSAAKSVDDAEQYIKKHPMYVKHKPTKIEYVKEEVEQIDEISTEKKMEYGKAAFADYHKQSKAKLGKILSGDKDTSGESRKIANRLKGISTSSKTEEVELDEAKTDVYHQHMLKALGKTRLPKDHGYTSSIANNGDFVVRKGGEVAGRIPKGEHNLNEASMTPTDMKQREDIVKGMKKSAQDFKDRYGSKWKSVMYATATKAAMKEEVEELDEISRDLARSYIRKVADKNNTGEASPKEVMKRSPGVVLAGKKAYGIGGKARVNATEEVELDQTHQSEKRGE